MSFKENELIETTLSEISIDGKGSYGISASAVEYSNNLYTYLRITDITDNGKLIKDGLKSVDDENAYKYILKPNDIVFARTGNSTGRSYFYDGSDGELVYAGFLIKFSLDSKKVNPKFMRYYTLSEEYRKWVASFSTGSTRGNINAKTYGNMKIRLPERKQQDFLVEILSDLDEKIEVNNKINKNLEEMAQAIFKQWFVDFEFPNEEGKPYKSSGGEMVESELGMIPKGWEKCTLDKVANVSAGGDKPKKFSKIACDEYTVPIYSNGIDREGLYGYTDKAKILEESVTVSARGTIGYVCLRHQPYVPIVRLISVTPNTKLVSAKYLYFLLKRTNIIGTGTTQQQLTVPDFKKTKMYVPQYEYMKKFTIIVNSWFERINNNNIENEILEKLRDTLLPKLMSGEIRVPLENSEN